MNEDNNDGLTELEKEFSRTVAEVGPKIQKKLDEASRALDEAVRLSEENGIPFVGNPTPLNNNYVPISYDEKFGELDEEFVSDLTDVWPNEFGGDGWAHSDIC